MKAWLVIIFAALPLRAGAAEPGKYFAWREGPRRSIVCVKSDQKYGSLGDCEQPGPKDLVELYCDSNFAKGARGGKKLRPVWEKTCEKYEKLNRHAVVMRRTVKYFAWQQGRGGAIECKEVPKWFGTPGKCIYPGPKNLKELYCDDKFYRYSGRKIDQDAYCHRHPWKPPVRTAEEDENAEEGGGPATSAESSGDGKSSPVVPAEGGAESGVSDLQ